MRYVAIALGALVLTAALILGGWQAGWWFKTQNINRDAKVTRQSYGYQQTYREQVTKDIADVLSVSTQIASAPDAQVRPLKAQRVAILAQLCQQATQVEGGLPVDQEAFIEANCMDGAVNPDSEYTR